MRPGSSGCTPKSYTLGHAWLKNRKPNDVGNNILKYQRIDATLRTKLPGGMEPAGGLAVGCGSAPDPACNRAGGDRIPSSGAARGPDDLG